MYFYAHFLVFTLLPLVDLCKMGWKRREDGKCLSHWKSDSDEEKREKAECPDRDSALLCGVCYERKPGSDGHSH